MKNINMKKINRVCLIFSVLLGCCGIVLKYYDVDTIQGCFAAVSAAFLDGAIFGLSIAMIILDSKNSKVED